MDPDQIILIDKPANMTSFGVVARIRRKLSEQIQEEGEQSETAALPTHGTMRGNMVAPHKPSRRKVKVGHCGTLDPFATGLLVIVTGKFTKRAGEFTSLDKSYEAHIILGKTSTTGDPEGEITEVSKTKPSLSQIQSTFSHFTGEILQTPPIFSAIKINGQRAYRLARKGQTPDIPPRKVTIHRLEITSYDYPHLHITTHVSSGTYIRSLTVDIGSHLKTGAYLHALRRTSIGNFDIKDAQKLADFGITD